MKTMLWTGVVAALCALHGGANAQFIQVMKTGLGVLGAYGADKCSTVGEVVQQTVNSTVIGGVTGLAVGAVLGAAITGSPSKAGEWGAGGAVLGAAGMNAAAAGNQTVGNVVAGRDLYRQRDMELCKLVVTTEEQVKPIWENFAADNRTMRCNLPADRMKVTDEQIDACMNEDPLFIDRLKQAVAVNGRINLGACEAANQIVKRYDRLVRTSAKSNQSVVGMTTMPCDGSDFPKQYRWALP